MKTPGGRQNRRTRTTTVERTGTSRRPPDPTPDEIRAECAAIQATWSVYEEHRRRGSHSRATYSIPRIHAERVTFNGDSLQTFPDY